MYKIGMSSCAFQLEEETFKKLAQNKIDAIEFSEGLEGTNKLDYKKVYEYAKQYNINLWSFHLPFMPFDVIDISSTDAAMRKYTLDYYSEIIKKAADIGLDKFVVHPSGEPIPDEERAARMEASMDSLDKLAEIAHKNGAVIAVEDLPRTCLGNSAEDVLKLISANDKLRVCFDTNHLLMDNNMNFMDKLGDKIVTVHISDYDFINERHWLPGEGKLDWKAMMAKFKEIGYNGVWMYEIGMRCPKTIIRDRNLDYADYYRNANELFEGKELTVIGKNIEGLGMYPD